MAWKAELEGYRSWNGDRVTTDELQGDHYSDVMGHIYGGGIDGLFVHVTNEDDPEEDHWFWVYHLEYFTDWPEAWDLIEDAASNYGIEL